jgi:outer membrane protein OmpA-like peptidoglycan-associated protein
MGKSNFVVVLALQVFGLTQISGRSLNGHTNSIGDDAYNVAMSERRAASVATWLTTKGGIPAGRLEAKGFGKTSPVAANRNSDGSDNPEGRQKNRRVEVIIPRK